MELITERDSFRKPPTATGQSESEANYHSTYSLSATSIEPNFVDSGIFECLESNVRTYCRSFPVVFEKASGSRLIDENGVSYIDFLAGAGALNYGHNPRFIRERLVDYLLSDGIVQGLDLYTVSKRNFLQAFQKCILQPRELDYRVQFCGPTGANSVEAALKLARMATKRTNIVSFTGGWHGMTAGCLAVTGNKEHREAAGVPLSHVIRCPYPTGPFPVSNGLELLESLFSDSSSGVELPAAVILETVQGEGGIFVADTKWLKELRSLCNRFGILMIVDDIQAGCGRTGTFFSFERAGIVPDIVCLSKSIGGYGLPMSLLLMKPTIDCWQPGQHTGTFRGNQLAFVAATAALELWEDELFQNQIQERSNWIETFLEERVKRLHAGIMLRGLGMIWGVDVSSLGDSEFAKRISGRCFCNGLIIERCGRDDTTLKILPPLTITRDDLFEGLTILQQAIAHEIDLAG